MSQTNNVEEDQGTKSGQIVPGNRDRENESRIKSTCYIYGMCFNAALGIFFLGFNQGVFNVVQLAILELKEEDEDNRPLFSALMSSSNPLGGLIGALVGTYILHAFKTIKRSFIFLDIVGMIATAIMLIAVEYPNIIIGRFIQGIVQGVNMALVPIYIREFSPLEILGKTASFVQLGQKGGLLSAYLFGLILPTKKWFHDLKDDREDGLTTDVYDNEYEWRIVLCIPIFYALLRIIGLVTCFRFDTPTDLLKKHQEEELKRFLHLVYKENKFDDVYQQTLKHYHELELRKMNEEAEMSEKTKEEQQKQKGRQFLEMAAKENDDAIEKDQQNKEQSHHDQDHQISENDHDEKHLHTEAVAHHDEDHLKVDHVKLHQISEEITNKVAHAPYDPNDMTESQMMREEQEFERVEKVTRFRRRMLGWTISLTVSFSGIDAIFYYSNKIFEEGGIEDYATFVTICIGVSSILFSFVGMAAVDSAGRRPLLLAGSYLMCLGLAGMVVGDAVDQIALVIAAIILFMFGYNSTLGPVKWACYVELMDEFGVSVAASMIFIFAFIIALVFPFMVDGMGLAGAFSVFLGLSIYCLVYLTIEFKETKGKTKLEIYPMFERKAPVKKAPKYTTNASILEIQGRSQVGLSFRGKGASVNQVHKSFRESYHQSMHQQKK